MKIVACLNLKGGVGKTTIAINLAAAIGEKKKRTLIVDLDPQRSAARWASRAKEGDSPYFDLRRDVHAVESKSARVVKEELERLSRQEADVIVLDCPPELEDRSLVAAMLAELVLIPTTPSPLDLWAAQAAVNTVRDARAVRETELPAVALVPSRLVSTTVLARELPESLEGLGEPVAPGISQRVALVEAAVASKTIGDYALHSASHREFLALAAYVLKRLLA